MPISEDEYEQQSNISGMSKADQRRSNKPIMEKRRRARINHCLNELKSLILDAMKKDPARHSKLEKADILEMTVKHLQSIQRQQLAVAVATDPTVLHKFKTGFSECATEVSRYIARLEGVDPAVRQRLLAHLSSCVAGLQQLTPFSFMAASGGPVVSPPASNPYPSPAPIPGPTALPQVPFPAGDVNNNHTRLLSSLQLIPSRLPSGELALLVPGSAGQGLQPFFPSTSTTSTSVPSATVTSGAIERSHPSAFTAVTRSSNSPPPRPVNALSPASSSSDESLSSFPSAISPPPSFKAPPPPPKPEARTEVKLELKTVAVPNLPSAAIHHAMFPRLTSSIGTSTSPPPDQPSTSRDALDFSMKPPPPRKRYAEDEERGQDLKVPRLSVHLSTYRQPEASVSRPYLGGEDLSRRHAPPSAAAGNDSMWRPWHH